MVPRRMLADEWEERSGGNNALVRALADLLREKRIVEVPLGYRNARAYRLPD